ncbi:DUF2927 domain-containing protein [Alphaproteobacteria bacterium KMM 3653]|uniref:DUF2927 domain-containing protein n=1 Tax=Harenicola maris TaxID=2841044 RepID=A0AAP2CM84_9RHOB|nr:DUF2927 domain-containing protein [Harenicola maris]
MMHQTGQKTERRRIAASARALTGAALAFGLLIGCEPAPTAPPPEPVPKAAPIAVPDFPKPPPYTPSAASREIRTHFTRVQENLLAQGLLRRDGGGPDTPFKQRELVENFERIALYNEYGGTGSLTSSPTPSPLKRWTKPVRVSVSFGNNVPAKQKIRDQALVAGFTSRLARITGHPITFSKDRPNFHVLILDEDDRQTYGPKLRQIVPYIDNTTIRIVQKLPKDIFCAVLAFSDPSGNTYDQAVVVIRSEHPDLLRQSCIHEEMAQGLGLANDSPRARPSIFNDDEEFALLTRHDELLLKMLYDPRLKPGMTAKTARPITTQIASELLGGPS